MEEAEMKCYMLGALFWDLDRKDRLSMSVKATDFITRFFVFAPSFGIKEGDEERKLLFYSPSNQDVDRKLKSIGYTEAFTRFARTFTDKDEPFVEVGTEKDIEVSCEVEKGYFVTFGCSKALSKNCRYAIRGQALSHVLHNFYALFRLFFGRFDDHIIRLKDQRYPNPEPLRRRLAHFCPRYFDLLRLHLWPLMDLLEGVNYLSTDPLEFLKVQSIFNRVTEQFPTVRHCMLLCNDRLLYHTMPKSIVVLLYRYMVDTLLPRLFRRELQPENRRHSVVPDIAQEARNSPSPSPSRSPSPSPAVEQGVNSGRFVTDEAFIYPFSDGSDLDLSMHGMPKIYFYADEQGSRKEYYLVVYRIFTVTLLVLVPSNEPSFIKGDFKLLLDAAVGTQTCDLAYSLTDTWAKIQNDSSQLPYPFIYYNASNCHLYCTLTPAAVLAPVSPPHYLYGALFDLRKEMDNSSYFGNVLTKAESDYWLVAKKAESRELYALAHRKSATMIEVNEEINKLCAQKFEHEFLLE